MKKLGYIFSALCIGLFQNMNIATAETELTPGQSSQVQGFLKSQADWTNVIANELQKSTGNPALPPATGTNQPLNQHALEQDCDIKVVPPSEKGTLSVGSAADNDQTQIGMFTVTIDGQGCPVEIHASIDGQQSQNSFHATMIATMKLIDPTFAKQSDVDNVSMTMDITAVLTPQASNGVEVQVGLSLNGKAHSLSLGDVQEAVSITSTMDIIPPAQGQFLPGFALKMGEELKYQFSGFNADLQSEIAMGGLLGPITASYLVNGTAVSQEDFQTFLKSISLPLRQTPGSSSLPSNPSNEMTCEVRVYDASKVSKQALLSSISSQTPVVAPPLLDDSRKASANWKIDGTGAQAYIDFESQFITLTVATSNGLSNELTVLTGENGDVADQVGNYTFRLSCTAGAL